MEFVTKLGFQGFLSHRDEFSNCVTQTTAFRAISAYTRDAYESTLCTYATNNIYRRCQSVLRKVFSRLTQWHCGC